MPLLKSATILSAIAVLIALPTPTLAYSCSVPSIQSPAKRTVCSNRDLRKLNTEETKGYAALGSALIGDAREALINDHWTFLQTREGCKKDKRCHEASFNAQLRLYKTLLACKPGAESADCVSKAIEAHRQELHKAL